MKKRKIKKKVLYRFSFILFSIFSIFILLNINEIKIKYSSYITGYQENTIDIFLEEKIYNDVIKNKYSKTLEEIINTKLFQKEYTQEYLNINYISSENFLNEISIFLDKGYNSQKINVIYKKLNSESIKILLEENYYENIDDIVNVTYFKEDKLKRYITYTKKEPKKDLETIITYVNIGLDNPYYTNIQKVDNQEDILVLVNKYNQLDKSYKPKNLQKVSYGSGQLRKEAAIAFDEMCSAAKKENIKIYGGSGYRSYSNQLNVYNSYLIEGGKEYAEIIAARQDIQNIKLD